MRSIFVEPNPEPDEDGEVNLAGPRKFAAQPTRDVNQQGKRILELIEQAETRTDAAPRDLLRECLHSVLALYGDGLGRILQIVDNAGADGRKVRDALLSDKLVRGLLLIHGLHPVSLEARLVAALDRIRPYLQSHGGNVELLGLSDDIARLRLQGTCKSCPSSSVTLELAVRRVIEEDCPDLAGFEVEGVTGQSDQPPPGPCLGT